MKKAPKAGTSKSSPNKSKKEVQKLANGGWSETNTKLEGKSNLINSGTSALGGAALLGGTAMAANNQVDEQGNINVNKSTGAGALTGAGTGIKTGAALGSVFGPLGTLVGGGAGALIGGGIGAVTANKKAKGLNSDNAAAILEQQKYEQEALRKSALAQGVFNRNLENYADGGEIKGKGTAKSDSIKAKVKEGSFIVPAERAEEAEELREKVLVKAPKKANLKQSGGVDVKLSNGEHIFTPEEAEELMEQGIDLDKLAPDAKNKLGEHLNCGGKIKGYVDGGTVDPVKEAAKIKAEEDALRIAKGEYDAAKLQSAAKAAEKKKIYDALLARSEKIKETNKGSEKAQKELDALNKSYEDFSKTNEAALNAPKGSVEKGVGTSSRPDPQFVREKKKELLGMIEAKKKEVETLQATNTAAKNDTSYIPKELIGKTESSFIPKAEPKKTDYVTTDNAATPQLSGDGKVESAASNVVATPTRKAPVVPKATLPTPEPNGVSVEQAKALANGIGNNTPTNAGVVPQSTLATQALGKPITVTGSPSATSNIPQPAAPTPLSGTTTNTEPALATTPPASGNNYDKIGSVLAQAMSYGVPIAQTAIGINALNKAGKRPVNTIPSDYLGMIDQANNATALAQKNAQYGFTPEEQSLLNQQNQSATNAGIYAARNLSGGSAANALGNTRSALADSFGRNLQTKVQNRDLMLQKQEVANQRQQYANSLTAGKTALLNNIFDQKLNGWQQQQAAGSQLVGAGLRNADSAARYNEFLKQQQALNK